MKLKQKWSQYFSVKPKLAGSQSIFGQLPDVGREFGKSNPGFWMCLCFCLLSPRVYFSSEFPFFFFYCDRSNRENPPGNKLHEGSLAKWAINIGCMPHFNILVWNTVAEKLRKHFQRRPVVLALSWHPEQKAALLPSSWARREDASQSQCLVSSPQDGQGSIKSVCLLGERVNTKIPHQSPMLWI